MDYRKWKEIIQVDNLSGKLSRTVAATERTSEQTNETIGMDNEHDSKAGRVAELPREWAQAGECLAKMFSENQY